MEFKKLSAVEVVAEPSESANVLIEENGAIKKVAKEEIGGLQINAPAEVGQTIVVKAVDANGKPTEWEYDKPDLLIKQVGGYPSYIAADSVTLVYKNSYQDFVNKFNSGAVLNVIYEYVTLSTEWPQQRSSCKLTSIVQEDDMYFVLHGRILYDEEGFTDRHIQVGLNNGEIDLEYSGAQ